MTPNKTQLIEDAKAAGYEIKETGGDLVIVKRVGRRKKVQGLIIYGCGTAFDLSVDLGVARGIRSYKGMRTVLGLS